MKRKIALILILLLLPTILVNGATRAVYLVNSDFEDGFNSWPTWPDNNLNSTVDNVSKFGESSLKMQPYSTCWQNIKSNQVKAGDYINFWGYVFLDETSSNESTPAIFINYINSSGTEKELIRLQAPNEKEQWCYLEALNIQIPSDSETIQIVLENNTNNYVYFDSIGMNATVNDNEIIETDEGTKITWQPKDGVTTPTEDEKVIEPEVLETTINTFDKKEDKIFLDIKDHWAKENILYLASVGVILGVSETEFLPDREITNNEFNLLIKRISNKGDYEVLYPNEIITRQEAACILSDMLPNKLKIINEVLALNFYDSDNIENLDKISISVHNNIIKGKDGNMFDPKCGLTRGEVATILVRFINLFN